MAEKMKRVTLRVMVTVPVTESQASVEAMIKSALSENQYHGLNPSARVTQEDEING